MSREPNYIKIGLFVIAGIALLVASIVFLTIGSLRTEVLYFETYFDTPVHGLTVGSVIEDRGVPVGKVEKITFVNRVYDVDDDEKMGRYVMVIGSVQYDKTLTMPYEKFKARVQRRVADGLRVNLIVKPLTGMAYLNAEFLDPEKNPPLKISWVPKNFYIPSAPSLFRKYGQSIETILEDLSNVEIAKLSKKLEDVLNALDETLRQTGAVITDIQDSIKHFKEQAENFDIQHFLTQLDSLIGSLDDAIQAAQVDQLSYEARMLLVETRDAVRQFKKLLGDIDPEDSVTSLAQVFEQLDTTLWRFETIAQNNDPAVSGVLRSAQETLDELKMLIMQIKKNPAGALFSEPPPKSEFLR